LRRIHHKTKFTCDNSLRQFQQILERVLAVQLLFMLQVCGLYGWSNATQPSPFVIVEDFVVYDEENELDEELFALRTTSHTC